MRYAIEGRDQNGQWSEDNVIAANGPDVNRFTTEEEADEAMEELQEIFECGCWELRVVSVDDAPAHSAGEEE